MKQWPLLDLEDTFGDVLRKLMRGRRIPADRLARAAQIPEESLAAWLADDGVPQRDDAVTLARVLDIDEARIVERAQAKWYPDEVAAPHVRRHAQAPHPSNGFLLTSIEDGESCALVDPAGDPQALLARLDGVDERLAYILITHKHADHCDAASEIAAAFPRAQIVMHELDAHAIGSLAKEAIKIRDGEVLGFGANGHIQMLHTPGHTDGSSCFLYNATLFTGDTLFAGSVGGCFGDRTGYADILESVATKLFTLPIDTTVMPGHGPPTKIGWERSHNPFFRADGAR